MTGLNHEHVIYVKPKKRQGIGGWVPTVSRVAGWIAKREGQPKPWLARYRRPGSRQVESKAFTLKRDAVLWLAEKQANDDPDVLPGSTSLGDYADEWVESVDVRDSTRSFYRSFVSNQFAGLREIPLKDLGEDDVEAWVRELKTRYSPRTVRAAFSLLRRILEDAVTRRRLARSPVADRQRFQAVVPKAPKPRNPNTRFLTRGEVDELAGAIDPKYRAMVLLGAYAGLRWGEVAALSPTDLDVTRRELAVRSNLVQPDDGRAPYRTAQMKTDSSARTVALGDLTRVLEAHIAEYATEDWMFPSAEGGPLRASNWRRRIWIPATEMAGLAPLRFHDLRHTHAALLIAQGESVLVVQKRLGHARPSITLDIYGGLFPGADEAAADRLTKGL